MVDEATGAPLAGVYIDAWNAAGEHVETTLTELSGSFVLALSPGTYYLSTDNGAGLTDEVWENLLCPTGSAYVGGCDPTQGDPITVGDPGPAVASGIAFSLGRDLFEDGFESGDTAAWTAVVP